MSELRACKRCKRIVTGGKCPVCGSKELTSNWRGYLIILSKDSEIAKSMGIKESGRYAIRVR